MTCRTYSLFVWLAAAFALIWVAAASAQATPSWSTLRNEEGLTLMSSCQSDGKFVASAYTPEWRINATPDRWFSDLIKSRINSWSSAISAEPSVSTRNGVMSAAMTFAGEGGTWRAWFYGAVRNTDYAQWAVVLAPPGVSASDARVTEARTGAVELYSGQTFSVAPNYAPSAAPAARSATAQNKTVGSLKSAKLMNVLQTGTKMQSAEYRLMKDGYVLNIEPSMGDYVAIGKWARKGADYEITWAASSELVSAACFVAPPKAPTKPTARPGCRMQQTVETAFTTRSACDARGRNCVTQQVPYTHTVTREVCP
jgi:hypothetical protein